MALLAEEGKWADLILSYDLVVSMASFYCIISGTADRQLICLYDHVTHRVYFLCQQTKKAIDNIHRNDL